MADLLATPQQQLIEYILELAVYHEGDLDTAYISLIERIRFEDLNWIVECWHEISDFQQALASF